MPAARGAPEGTGGRGPAGEGTPRAAPPRPWLAPTASAPSPVRQAGRGPWSPEAGASKAARGVREAGTQPRTSRPAADGPPAATSPLVSLGSHSRCNRSPQGAGPPPPAPRLPTLTPAGPAPWSRPAFARIRDSPVRAPTRPAREPKGAWPPRCEPRARGPPRPPRPPRPTHESSARDQLRSFSEKEALRVRRLQLRKCSAFVPGASPSSAPSPDRFLLHFFAFCFFFLKSPTAHKELRVCSRQKS